MDPHKCLDQPKHLEYNIKQCRLCRLLNPNWDKQPVYHKIVRIFLQVYRDMLSNK
jgi:hypothetical protein